MFPFKSVWLQTILFSFFQMVSVPEDAEIVSRQQTAPGIVDVKSENDVSNVEYSCHVDAFQLSYISGMSL
jgi:hypothetical protein